MTPKGSKSKVPARFSLDALVVGGGSFGTALSSILARCGNRMKLWVRREEQAKEISRDHTNKQFFPEASLPSNLEATTDLETTLPRAKIVFMAIPSKVFREVSERVGNILEGDQILIHVTKGIERNTYKRMSEILREETCALKIGVLSGPNLAKELMAGHPAGALIASHYDEVVRETQKLFEGGQLRLYGGKDVIGTEIGGAFKNIIALAAGAATGMGFGDNTKSLLITRGLSEMAQYGVANGANVFTFGGLSGIGDLMATCGSPLSRNHQVGSRLAKGEKLKDILASTHQVAEGVTTTMAVHEQMKSLKLKLPIVEMVYSMLYEEVSPPEALKQLMVLPTGSELAALRY